MKISAHALPSLLLMVATLLWARAVSAAPDSPTHWSFQPIPAKIESPAVSQEGNPIDAFIAAGLRSSELSPSPVADRRTQIRRLFLALHGLPPTPSEVRDFLKVKDPDSAYRQLTDTLLASPRYGERWAQHWLDVVRYADTHGFEVNTERANAWPYRDYVIKAFNEDKPYDKFVFEQLAGDSIREDAATGFMVASAVLLPGQIGKDDVSKRLARQDSLDEIVVATGDTFLAMSLGCARCHAHKFDPVSQRDYYTMQAFFAGVDYGERPLHNEANQSRINDSRTRIAAIRNRLDSLSPQISGSPLLVIDDEDTERTSILKKKNGHGSNPPGAERGYKDDPGSADRVPNISRGRYTWWDNHPGEDVFTYNPASEGQFRIWISWGVHGSGVHTRDARYILDIDGDLATKSDQSEFARADQYYFANTNTGESEKKPLWSGFLDCSIHELRSSSRILLRGGDTGTGITADAIVLQKVGFEGKNVVSKPSNPALRGPVNSLRNVERFAPVPAKYVRFTSFATIENNKHEPCIDELEIFTAGEGKNVAIGAKASSSGDNSGDPQHQLKNINDGRYGNARSWISNQSGKGWVQLELPEAVTIDRIVWARDREGKFKDRLAHNYRIEVATEPGKWTTVAHSEDRIPYGAPYDATTALLRNLPEDAAESLKSDAANLAKLEKSLENLQKQQVVFAGSFREPDQTYLLNRGDPEQQVEPVPPSIPNTLGSLTLEVDAPEQERRVALAQWIANDQNPLTARVMVNRIWQSHFGTGLVETASDFGLNGARPSHPELLDWLSRQFIDSGWSIKHLHRLIVNSKTYRQSSRIDPVAQAIDRDCRLLWRFPSRRLEAEAIRDSILSVSGQLNLKMGGPGFNFFKSRGGLNGFPVIEAFESEGLRRMIYSHKVRMERVPVFGAFDCPDAGQATPRRSRATTAIQALNLFNSRFIIDQANKFAERIRAELGAEAHNRPDEVKLAFLIALGREPSPLELESSQETVRQHGLETLCRVLYNSNEFLFLP